MHIRTHIIAGADPGVFDEGDDTNIGHQTIHHIPKCQQFYYSFIVMLIGPRCLDRILGIQKNF